MKPGNLINNSINYRQITLFQGALSGTLGKLKFLIVFFWL